MQPGNQRPEENLDQNQNNKQRRTGAQGDSVIMALVRFSEKQVKSRPENVAENQKSQRQMRRKAIMAHVNPVHQSALHHVPAEKTLRAPQQKHDRQFDSQGSFDPIGKKENTVREQEMRRQ